MVIEKTYKCCSYLRGMDDLILEAAEDIKKSYHVIRVEREETSLSSAYPFSPNVIVTLRKEV